MDKVAGVEWHFLLYCGPVSKEYWLVSDFAHIVKS